MKSLARLLIIHVFISIFLFLALTSGAISHTVLLLLLLFFLRSIKDLRKYNQNGYLSSTQPSSFSSYPFHNF